MMFYAVIPTVPPMFAVQPGTPQLSDAAALELLTKLERHFMLAVALVSWDSAGTYRNYGTAIAESLVTREDLAWRKVELPCETEVPF